jgi:hypothetical protein
MSPEICDGPDRLGLNPCPVRVAHSFALFEPGQHPAHLRSLPSPASGRCGDAVSVAVILPPPRGRVHRSQSSAAEARRLMLNWRQDADVLAAPLGTGRGTGMTAPLLCITAVAHSLGAGAPHPRESPAAGLDRSGQATTNATMPQDRGGRPVARPRYTEGDLRDRAGARWPRSMPHDVRDAQPNPPTVSTRPCVAPAQALARGRLAPAWSSPSPSEVGLAAPALPAGRAGVSPTQRAGLQSPDDRPAPQRAAGARRHGRGAYGLGAGEQDQCFPLCPVHALLATAFK